MLLIFVFGLFLTRSVVGGEISLTECKPIEVNGYLHEHCPSPDHYFTFKCPRSNITYYKYSSEAECEYSQAFSITCPSDPGFYQVCGHSGCTGSRELGGTPLLCGTFICDRYTAVGTKFGLYRRCKKGSCGNTELNMVGCTDVIAKCNHICTDVGCSDESYCNGVQYGIWCEKSGKPEYIPPLWMCHESSLCDNAEDQIGCFNWTVADHTTCQLTSTSNIIRIKDNMRCFRPDRSACEGGQDQTNCSDPERVVMQCLSQGFPTTISIWGYCQGHKLCDDGYNNACADPELGCKIHKGQFCDGHRDCNYGGDETCQDLTTVSCIRRFRSPNVEKNVSLPIPLEWVMDGQVDCLDGKDEDESYWLKCGKDYYTREELY
eukprot:sb/3465735/